VVFPCNLGPNSVATLCPSVVYKDGSHAPSTPFFPMASKSHESYAATATPVAPTQQKSSVTQLSNPNSNEIIFTGRCYLITAYPINAYLVLQTPPNPPPGTPVSTLAIPLSSTKFTLVEGGTYALNVNSTNFPPTQSVTFGPNSWGIVQPIDGGFIGYGLSMTPPGGPTSALFKNPNHPSGVGAPEPAAKAAATATGVSIVNGGIWNGLYDASLLMAYVEVGGKTFTTSKVPSGHQALPPPQSQGPTPPDGLITGTIVQIDLNLAPDTTSWIPAEPFKMEEDMSLVVTGDFSQPMLTIMVHIGPLKTIPLVPKS